MFSHLYNTLTTLQILKYHFVETFCYHSTLFMSRFIDIAFVTFCKYFHGQVDKRNMQLEVFSLKIGFSENPMLPLSQGSTLFFFFFFFCYSKSYLDCMSRENVCQVRFFSNLVDFLCCLLRQLFSLFQYWFSRPSQFLKQIKILNNCPVCPNYVILFNILEFPTYIQNISDMLSHVNSNVTFVE